MFISVFANEGVLAQSLATQEALDARIHSLILDSSSLNSVDGISAFREGLHDVTMKDSSSRSHKTFISREK